MDDVQDTVDITTAAGRMGITPEAVRKRIARGTLPATKQDGRWYVVLDGQDGQGPASWTGRPTPDGIDSVQDAVQDDKDKLIEVLQAQVESQGAQLEARTREVQELHVLLQQTQAALPPPRPGIPGWRQGGCWGGRRSYRHRILAISYQRQPRRLDRGCVTLFALAVPV